MERRISFALKILVSAVLVSGLLFFGTDAPAGLYLSSVHGSNSSGVSRTGMDASGFGYSRGNCVHCHEQHASINDSEPDPVNGAPSNYTLFSDNFLDQSNDFCFQCHAAPGLSLQTGGIVNRSYSYRAGGYTIDTLNNIWDAFNSISWSSHNLPDIRTFINGKWGYTSDSNPCSACHNSHAATAARPVSRPSQFSKNNNSWAIWGDDSGERMNIYTSNYQPPYLYNSTTQYEPAATALTDYVTFCTDCHNSTNIISSSALGTLKTIDWSATGLSADKHGQVDADGTVSLNNPYGSVIGKVLACTDCHEPHGSPNKGLIRVEVNGAVLGATIDTIRSTDACTPPTPAGPFYDTDKTIASLCNRCHKDDNKFNGSCLTNRYYMIHHDSSSGDPPFPSPGAGTCINCHSSVTSESGCTSTLSAINCNCCHYHGSSINPGGGTRKTF